MYYCSIMEKDNKSYCFVFVLNRTCWCFVAHNNIYQGNMALLEKWKINNKIFFLARFLYTKEEATEMVKNTDIVVGKNGQDAIRPVDCSFGTGHQVLSGPDMYCVVNGQTNQIVATVQKPNIPMIEIRYNEYSERIHEKSSYQEIRINLINYLEKTFVGKIIATVYAKEFSHFVYF